MKCGYIPRPLGRKETLTSTVSEHGNEKVIANYVKNKGNEYKKLYRNNEIEGERNMYDYV